MFGKPHSLHHAAYFRYDNLTKIRYNFFVRTFRGPPRLGVFGEAGSSNSMACVYVLKSTVAEITYVGSTTDLDRRLNEHNSGKNFFTRRHCPWRVVYQEQFDKLSEARSREKYLKSGAGRRWLRVNNIIPR